MFFETRQEAVCFVCERVLKAFRCCLKSFLLSAVPREPRVLLSPGLAHLHRALSCALAYTESQHNPGSLFPLNVAFLGGTKANQSWLYKATDRQNQHTVSGYLTLAGVLQETVKAKEDIKHVLVDFSPPN